MIGVNYPPQTTLHTRHERQTFTPLFTKRGFLWSKEYDETVELVKIPYLSPLYPSQLKNIPGPPKVLYAKGNVDLLGQRSVAMVGSRDASQRGIALAKDLAQAAIKTHIVTISGLARGIDTAVHTATLAEGGKTIAVLAHGLEQIYPPENKSLAQEILASDGLLLSELPLGTPIRKDLFLARNRIVVGLGLALVVVEAQLRSGSLSSATHAAEQGKDVLALVGSPGTDLLIEEGAIPLNTAADFSRYLAQAA